MSLQALKTTAVKSMEKVRITQAIAADAVEERAIALTRLHDDGGLTWAEVGKVVGLSRVRAESAAQTAEERARRRSAKKR